MKIGVATKPIAPGEHVHSHNLGMGDHGKDDAFCSETQPTQFVAEPATFQGIVRPDGRVATRNCIGVLTTVNCSATVATYVADAFRRNPFTGQDPLAEFPDIDGVVALTHKTGCGMSDDEPLRILRRTLAGYATHPNFAAIIVLGLGCEVNQLPGLMEQGGLDGRPRVRAMTIQATGGTPKTVARGVEFVREALAEANAQGVRRTVPASHITVALQCGGSDG